MSIAWERYRLSIASVGKVRCEPGWQIGPAWSRRLGDFDLWVIRAGEGVLHYPGGEAHLRPGICLWLRAGDAYEAWHNPRRRLAVTYIHFDLLDARQHRPGRLPPHVLESPATSYFEAVSSRIVSLWRSNREAAHDLLRGLLRDFEASAEQAQHVSGTALHHYELMMDAASTLAEDVSRRRNVAELAREAGYSTDHFSRLFLSVMGRTPQDYAVQARVERARELLRNSAMSVKEIARALGYRGVHFFSRQFTAKSGITPTAYRQAGQPACPGERL